MKVERLGIVRSGFVSMSKTGSTADTDTWIMCTQVQRSSSHTPLLHTRLMDHYRGYCNTNGDVHRTYVAFVWNKAAPKIFFGIGVSRTQI